MKVKRLVEQRLGQEDSVKREILEELLRGFLVPELRMTQSCVSR